LAATGFYDKEHNVSTALNSVMKLSPYSESAPTNTPIYRPDHRIARKPERAETSFLDTIVGRRGSLRAILNQVDAVAGTNTTVLITGETGTARKSSRERFTSSAPAEAEI
jgi:transcriptional regulator with GAF, ATPase, and Fis domain